MTTLQQLVVVEVLIKKGLNIYQNIRLGGGVNK